jgi:hypothetical protein
MLKLRRKKTKFMRLIYNLIEKIKNIILLGNFIEWRKRRKQKEKESDSSTFF